MSIIALSNTNKAKALNALKVAALFLSNSKPVLVRKVPHFN
jgi:hypothetical protein